MHIDRRTQQTNKQMTTIINDKSQLNLTNASVEAIKDGFLIGFPRVEHLSRSDATTYPCWTELVAFQKAPGEVFKISAVTLYAEVSYPNDPKPRTTLREFPASAAQIASILAK